MASLQGEFDPEAEPSSDREPFAGGDYKLELTETDVVPTNAGDGKLFKYTAKVIEGEFTGRVVWGQINLQNKSAQAQEIGQREFSSLRHATGVLDPQDTTDLQFKAFMAKVVIEPEKTDKGKTYAPRNAIKKFYIEGEDSAPAGKQAPAAKPPVASNDNKASATPPVAAKRPWKKAA